MKFRTIQTTIFTACLCACMTAFSGCSKGANEPYEMQSGDSSLESGGGYSDESSGEYSDESSETSSSEISDDDISSESSKPQTNISEKYPEIVLDHEYLETVEGDILDVNIYLYMDEEVLRAEFEAKYPELIGKDGVYYYYWPRYLRTYGEQIIREFMKDYGIAYEDLHNALALTGRVSDEFDKETLSLMLDDPRVAEIVYYPNGRALAHLSE